jgi:hypothetical protein
MSNGWNKVIGIVILCAVSQAGDTANGLRLDD